MQIIHRLVMGRKYCLKLASNTTTILFVTEVSVKSRLLPPIHKAHPRTKAGFLGMCPYLVDEMENTVSLQIRVFAALANTIVHY